MNPLLVQALSAIIRHFLSAGAGVLVAHGIWNANDAESYVSALAASATAFLLAAAWSLINKINWNDLLERAIRLPSGIDPRRTS